VLRTTDDFKGVVKGTVKHRVPSFSARYTAIIRRLKN
jgi:hypothetical protein